jgi:hypothetical protein
MNPKGSAVITFGLELSASPSGTCDITKFAATTSVREGEYFILARSTYISREETEVMLVNVLENDGYSKYHQNRVLFLDQNVFQGRLFALLS